MYPAWTEIFVDHPWLAPLAWVVLHSLDYFLTLYGSYLYHSGANRVIRLAGSYELNPLFQGAIDKRKLLSRRFLLSLTLVAAALYVIPRFYSERPGGEALFAFVLGAVVFPRIGLIGLHLANVHLFRTLLRPDCPVVGSITWLDRRHSYSSSAAHFATLAALLGFAAAVSPSAWLFGGIASCVVTALYMLVLMPRRRSTPRSPDGKESNDGHHTADHADAVRPGAERP